MTSQHATRHHMASRHMASRGHVCTWTCGHVAMRMSRCGQVDTWTCVHVHTWTCPTYVKRVVRREHHSCALSSMVRWGVAAPPFHTKWVFSVTAATLFFSGSELSSVVRSGRCVSKFGSDQIFRNLAKHISGGEKTQKALRSMVASVFRVCSGSFLILFGILRLRGMPILGMQVVFLETRFVGFPMKAHHFCTLSSMVRSEVRFRWFPLREGFRASGSTKCANFYAYPL